jgi:hypothetical protein
MARIFVETWSPEYGAPLDLDETLAPAEGAVDDSVETSAWAPRDGTDDGVDRVAFVDGVRRVDARLTVDDPEVGPVPGICGTYAVGAVLWDRLERRSQVAHEKVERMAVLAGNRPETLPPIPLDPPYRNSTTPSLDPSGPVQVLHSAMRTAEGRLTTELPPGHFVVADGPLNEFSAASAVGYVKSHRVLYLSPERNQTVAQLRCGQRTPMFTISGQTAFFRYSWYVRIAEVPGGHSWTGVVRCEASGLHPVAEAALLADRTAALLPLLASEPHIDARAPQNLVPIAALERALRHRMGDARLVERALKAAAAERRAS